MDINAIDRLRMLFEPFDLPHFLGLSFVLTLFIFLWGLVVASNGSYSTASRFWKVLLLVLTSVYALSSVGFLILNIDPLLLLISLIFLAFLVQGHLGTTDQETSLEEDWWAFRIRRRQNEEEEEQKH